MSSLNNISNKVKSSFEANAEKTPAMVWDKINNSLNNKSIDSKVKSSFEKEIVKAPVFDFSGDFENKYQIDEKISESFESQRNVLPNSIWQNIENSLDVNNVWSGMANQIRINAFSWHKFAVASIIIGFIILFPPTQLKNPQIVNNINMMSSNSSIKTKHIVSESLLASTIIEQTTIKNTNIEDAIVLNQNSKIINSPENISALNTSIQDTKKTNNIEDNTFNKNSINLDRIKTPIKLLAVNANSILAPFEITNPVKSKKQTRFRVGLLASINNTWINDSETRSSFNKNSLTSSKMTFGESRGLTADYYFSDKFGISATYLLQSRSKNRVGYYDNGLYQIKTTEINYSKGAILLNFSKPILRKKSMQKYVFSAGPYLAYNKNSTVISGETITSFNSSFKKLDYGLKLQIGKEHQWSDLVLGYGLTTDIGARNILISNNTLNNYTSNFNIGLFTTLKYEF